MNLEAGDDLEEHKEAHQLFNKTLVQRRPLPNNRAHFDVCSTVMAFKKKKFLQGIKKLPSGIKTNCKIAGAVTTYLMGRYGSIKAWHILKRIANIFSMHKLEKWHRITYGNWEGFYIHMPSGPMKFNKDKRGLS
jgi:hypothetical protein